jgi:hypothetical protein
VAEEEGSINLSPSKKLATTGGQPNGKLYLLIQEKSYLTPDRINPHQGNSFLPNQFYTINFSNLRSIYSSINDDGDPSGTHIPKSIIL